MLLAQNVAPEPNTPITLGLDFIFGAVPAAVLISIAFRRPMGIWARYQRYLTVMMLLLGVYVVPVLLVQIASTEEGGPKAIAFGLGLLTGLAVAGARAHRDRPSQVSVPTMRGWHRRLDYAFGVVFYVLFAYCLASASTQLPSSTVVDWVANELGLFVVSQVTIGVFYRIVNQSLEHDYSVSLNAHYVLAAVPVGISVAIYVVAGASPIGPLFALFLLGLSRHYTDDRPRGTIKTLLRLKHASARTGHVTYF
jgi:hypothetical protein